MSSLHPYGELFRGFLRQEVFPSIVGNAPHSPPPCRVVATPSATNWVEAFAADLRIAGCACSVNRQARPGTEVQGQNERVILVGTPDLRDLSCTSAVQLPALRPDQRVIVDEITALISSQIQPILIQLAGSTAQDVFPSMLPTESVLDCRAEDNYFSCFFKSLEVLYGSHTSQLLQGHQQALNKYIAALQNQAPLDPQQASDFQKARGFIQLDKHCSTVLSPNSANAVDALSSMVTAPPRVPFATPSKAAAAQALLGQLGARTPGAPPGTPLPYATPDAATTLSKLSQLAHATSFVVSDPGEVRRPRQRRAGRGRTLLPPTSKGSSKRKSGGNNVVTHDPADDDDDVRATKRARSSAAAAAAASRTNTGEKEKSLRHLSLQVCDKVRHKDSTTYNEVADELVADLATAGPVGAGHNEKNIRRRVYDALNVLEGMDIINREKKKIQWAGLPGSSEITSLEHNKRMISDRIQEKLAFLQEVAVQHVTLDNLMTQNTQGHRKDCSKPEAQLHLPFVLVNANPESEIECQMNDEKTELMFTFSTPFELHDDSELLRGLGMSKSIPKHSQVAKVLPKKILAELDLNIAPIPTQ